MGVRNSPVAVGLKSTGKTRVSIRASYCDPPRKEDMMMI